MGSVKRADAFEPAQNVCEIRTENAAIGVNFINHDVFQVFKELDPFRVMRQNALMQHIRIRHHNVSCLPDRRARGRRRIAVIGVRLDVLTHLIDHGIQFGNLIAGKRLRRKQVQCARRRILQNRIQHRRVIAKRFSGRSRRDHDEIALRNRGFNRHALVNVRLFDAARTQHVDHARIQRFRKCSVMRCARGQYPPFGHVFHEKRIVFQLLNVFLNGHLQLLFIETKRATRERRPFSL